MTLAELRSILAADFARSLWRPERRTLIVFRLGQYTEQRETRRILAWVLWRLLDALYLRLLVGAEFPPSVKCGPGILLHHAGRGIVLHPDAVIGDRVNLYHGVTIGQAGHGRPPILGDDVYLGVGCKVLGPITVENRAKVGAGAVVVHDVPADTTVVGVPARRVPRQSRPIDHSPTD